MGEPVGSAGAGAPAPGRPLPWEQAWQHALYGPAGFFTAGSGPAAHFRTAVHAAGPLLARALLRLAAAHGCHAVVDLGAGRGELLTAVAARPAAAPLRLHGVDVVARPGTLPPAVGWSRGLDDLPDDALDGALVVAWELLDDVPCPVLEVDDDGVPRIVLVDPISGAEHPGPPAGSSDLAWCARWWPLDGASAGTRAEVGRPREELWAGLVKRVGTAPSGGILLAVDYAHDRRGRPGEGSLSAFRGGRAVPPVPDGSCDLTAHVALDAVAAAGRRAGATGTRLTDQRTGLAELGVGAADRLDPADPTDHAYPTDPAAHT
ncbi:MAG TPA: SAM-dependent methyltransferase, partial [Kineosporiaceae bacterium]|nr:SAM-dependent methyltransferase [Kineosporiaceae bacterium]